VNVIPEVAFTRSQEIQPRPAQSASPAPAPDAPAGRSWADQAPWAVRLAAALAGLVVVGVFVFVALSRLRYPYALEHLEGNSLVEVRRILAGQPLYPAPSAGYVPDGYPPLYFALCAAVARVLGASYATLRLVSLASALACFALLAALIRRETGSVAAGIGGAGAFAATYFATAAWFDIGRVDSLFLALSIAGLYAARRMGSSRGAVAAGMLLAAAALTKQTGLAELTAVLAAALAGPRRRLAVIAGGSAVAGLLAAMLVLRLDGGGWSTFYMFKLMSGQSLIGANFGWFWTALLTATGLAAGAALLGARRVPVELLAGCAALVVEGCVPLVKSGGAINDVLPAYLAVALLAGLALGGARSRWTATAAGALVLAQIVVLLASSHPGQAIPTAADRAAGRRLAVGIAALGGTVAVANQPTLGSLSAPLAQDGAVLDVLGGTNKLALRDYRGSAEAAAKSQQYSVIITDSPGPPLEEPPALRKNYLECAPPAADATGASDAAAPLIPVAGHQPRAAWVWVAKGSGRSCASVLGVLRAAGAR
jgi:hypothetical protein